jgi:phosphoglycerate dehydrogenase-like enzyme
VFHKFILRLQAYNHTMPATPNGLYILSAESLPMIYGEPERAELDTLVNFVAPPQTPASIAAAPGLLADVDVIFSGWGAPRLDAALLAAAPKLRAFFYGAGSVRGFVTDAFWERGILLTSAYGANAVPVAEFTTSQVLFSLKHGWRRALHARMHHNFGPALPVTGNYGGVVGIISLGMIGRLAVQMLSRFDLKIIAYDPFVSAAQAATLGVELCTLDEVFQRADVVSLHTPWLKETERLIRGAHFESMRPNTTFINTARGAVVAEDEMIAALHKRPDVMALLDVTYPHEPPVPGSPLWTMPNVVLTPHIAGSSGAECRRMGRYMIDELKLYLAGRPLRWQITREKAAILA